ncbi:MAG: hypothetical protein H5U40_14350, partial [Polyangiaceae bacterium]|nr:hypothetical protein [Polyangiaceae bacterium]
MSPDRARLGFLPSVLIALVYASAAAVFAFPLSTTSSMIAAAVGAALGALLGPRLASSRLRTLPQLGIVALVVASAAAL